MPKSSISCFRGRQRVVLALSIGLLISFFLLYVTPLFFMGASEMRTAPGAGIPLLAPIGNDLVMNVSKCSYILEHLAQPWDTIVFSPLWVLTFGILHHFPVNATRYFFNFMSIASLASMCIYGPRWLGLKTSLASPALLFLGTSLFSYGLAFELERCQWNLFTLFLCIAALTLWRSPRLSPKLFGVILYTFAIHIKLWPVFLIPCFIDFTLDWRSNFRAIFFLVACNIMALFILGPHAALNYVGSLTYISRRHFFWSGDHSITSFSGLLGDRYGLRTPTALCASLLLAICVLYIIAITAAARKRIGDPSLLLACTVLAMLAPKVSHDYKLPILAVSTAIFFASYKPVQLATPATRVIEFGLLTLLSALFHSTLFAGWQKRIMSIPPTNTPSLLAILLIVTVLARLHWTARHLPDIKPSAAPQEP